MSLDRKEKHPTFEHDVIWLCGGMEGGKKKEENNSKDLPDENGDCYHFLL